MGRISAIVTDIEGTTSSIAFVHEVLFPYALQHLSTFLQKCGQNPEVQALLEEARREAGQNLDDARLTEKLMQWMEQDRKITPLKSLQGLIWRYGYENGDFKGHFYEDAVRNLQLWRQAGIKLYVYSSGSVQAQRLLFAHSKFGDLTAYISAYFDTLVGNKRECSAYREILRQIDVPGAEVLFLSDVVEELDAAQEAGMQVLQLVRDSSVVPGKYPVVSSFDEIDLES